METVEMVSNSPELVAAVVYGRLDYSAVRKIAAYPSLPEWAESLIRAVARVRTGRRPDPEFLAAAGDALRVYCLSAAVG